MRAKLRSLHAADERFAKRDHSDKPPHPYRSEYQRDRDRILYSRAFRKLAHKTQVFPLPHLSTITNRLTHTLEVMQIARTIARRLRLNEDLTEAIALGHDLGHAPFGHEGEDTINDILRHAGGFFHNENSVIIVEEKEQYSANFRGLNLTDHTREGILKHSLPADGVISPKAGTVLPDDDLKQRRKFLERFDRFQYHKGNRTLEGQIVDIADEIAYVRHDFKDLMVLMPEKVTGLDGAIRQVPDYIALSQGFDTSAAIEALVSNVIENSERMLEKTGWREGVDKIIDHPPGIKGVIASVKKYFAEQVYTDDRLKCRAEESQHCIRRLVEFWSRSPNKVPKAIQEDNRIYMDTVLAARGDDRLVEREVALLVASLTDLDVVDCCQLYFAPQWWSLSPT